MHDIHVPEVLELVHAIRQSREAFPQQLFALVHLCRDGLINDVPAEPLDVLLQTPLHELRCLYLSQQVRHPLLRDSHVRPNELERRSDRPTSVMEEGRRDPETLCVAVRRARIERARTGPPTSGQWPQEIAKATGCPAQKIGRITLMSG